MEENKSNETSAEATLQPVTPEFKYIIGRKLGMTQIFTPEGEVKAVTVIEAGPCKVVYTRTKDKDTGWYSYVWKVNLSEIYRLLENTFEYEIKQLEGQLDESTTIFSFYCPKCSKENVIDFEMAANLGFKCPHCQRGLKAVKKDNKTIIEKLEELKRKYADFKKEITDSNINNVKDKI